MTSRSRRLTAVPALTALTLTLALTGCSSVLDVLDDSPEAAQRDEPGGEITASADADVFSLQVGDCLNYVALSETTTEFASLPTVPCAEQHDAEIYAETTLTQDQHEADLALAENPEAETPTYAEQYCYDAFAGFVGTPYEESALDFSYLSPTAESWDQGDDVLQCIVVHLDGGLTGTMRDSAL